jgi:hypothetical protein
VIHRPGRYNYTHARHVQLYTDQTDIVKYCRYRPVIQRPDRYSDIDRDQKYMYSDMQTRQMPLYADQTDSDIGTDPTATMIQISDR